MDYKFTNEFNFFAISDDNNKIDNNKYKNMNDIYTCSIQYVSIHSGENNILFSND